MDDHLQAAVDTIRTAVSIQPKTGIVLGSGLGAIISEMTDVTHIPFEDIPHFPVSTVEGHRGEVVVGRFQGIDLLALSGRVHFYEGYTLRKIVFPIKVMAGLGIQRLIITNASGSINEAYGPGDIVLIRDHINLLGKNPLWGSQRFIGMTEPYSRALGSLASSVALRLRIPLREGVYCLLNGPSYETPAEIRMLRTMGADIAGMSTVPEVIAANGLGIEVLGLSMVTNMAAGITGEPLSHAEVIETSQRAGDRFRNLVSAVLMQL